MLCRAADRVADGMYDLLMVGLAGWQWHLEPTAAAREVITPSPTPEDLLVIYLAVPVSEDLVACAVAHGGTVVPALNPYWDDRGVTITDPDGYRVVLTQRSRAPTPRCPLNRRLIALAARLVRSALTGTVPVLVT